MKFFQILVFIFLSHALYAQKSSSNSKAQQFYQIANRSLNNGNYTEAKNNLLKSLEIDPKFATALQQMGDILRKENDFKSAIEYYQKVLDIDPNLTPLTLFALGESYLFTGQYELAKNQLISYQKKQNLSNKTQQLIEKYLNDIEFSEKNLRANSEIKLSKLDHNINTNDDEYFPKLTADNKTIIFTRKSNNQENFFESHFVNQKWSPATKLLGQVNSEDFNEGAHCISPDGKYLFFTGCNYPEGLGSCDIYVSRQENGFWSKPHNLGANINSKGWEAQPAISSDGKTLFFVSNRVGGIGGYDIWRSTLKENGEWSVAQNLGPQINTQYDESSPFLHADNKSLYFSSNGWPGFGQKDIFVSYIDSSKNWSMPKNLGSDINNFEDQNTLNISMDGSKAFLSSKINSSNLDIYTFDLPEYLKPKAVAYLKGIVSHEDQSISTSAKIKVTNTKNKDVIFQTESDYLDGTFLATLPVGSNYALHIQEEGYLFISENFPLDNTSYANKSFEKKYILKKIAVGAKSDLRNIYFEVNKYDLLDESIVDLQILLDFLKMNKKIKIELSGHTDNTGSDKTNFELSKNRAIAVQQYLIRNGIRIDRIECIGYGSSKPIADNTSEEGRQLNRRTTFTIKSI